MIEPLVLSRADAASYCGVCVSTFDDWVKRGILPGPIPGTRKWYRKAIGAALDKASCLVPESNKPQNPQVEADAVFQEWQENAC
jgi:hypothetical protein